MQYNLHSFDYNFLVIALGVLRISPTKKVSLLSLCAIFLLPLSFVQPRLFRLAHFAWPLAPMLMLMGFVWMWVVASVMMGAGNPHHKAPTLFACGYATMLSSFLLDTTWPPSHGALSWHYVHRA